MHGSPQIGLQHLDGKCFMGIVIQFSQNQKHRISNCNLERRLRQKFTMESVEQCVVEETQPCMTDIWSERDGTVFSVIVFEAWPVDSHKTGQASPATLLHVFLSELCWTLINQSHFQFSSDSYLSETDSSDLFRMTLIATVTLLLFPCQHSKL